MKFLVSALCIIPLVAFATASQSPPPASLLTALTHFESKVRPLLVRECTPCHGTTQQKAGIRLDRRQNLVTIPRIRAVLSHGNAVQMPPTGPLTVSERAEILRWLDSGAPWPTQLATPLKPTGKKQHWAFKPPQQASLPGSGKRNDSSLLDTFIAKRITNAGLMAGKPADKRTLLRRATYDLTGLPPTPAEMSAFLLDNRPGAWERVIERLLASTQYGEKWGRMWLDVVHYADTTGENSDHPVPQAWKYRNWVIDSFNQNLPYNTFLKHQIAGDLLAPKLSGTAARAAQIATGFLAGARRFGHDIDADMHLTYEDVIDTTSKAALGLSLACARCHDHKYDPIPQKDYYALYGVFQSSQFSYPGCEPFQQPKQLVPLLSAIEKTALDANIALLEKEVQSLKKDIEMAQRAQTEDLILGKLIAKGLVPDGGSSTFENADGSRLSVDVKRGDTVLLLLHPNANHGADTTLLKLNLSVDGTDTLRWSLDDLIDTLPGANPHADSKGNAETWTFLDMTKGLFVLPERAVAIGGQTSLRGWRHGETPSVFANTANHPVQVWTQLPPRSVFAHPGEVGPVGIAWTAPFQATVRVSGFARDAHLGGDGVTWEVRKVAGGSVLLTQSTKLMSTLSTCMTRITTLKEQRNSDMAYACIEGPTPLDAYVQIKGEPAVKGDVIPRGIPRFLGGVVPAIRTGSGRAELANWIASDKNPLTARVWVNRIWQGHFGTGIVATANDFGTRGAAPFDQALLDWLALRFIRTGWDTKAMHRTMMRSAAYKRVSGSGERAAKLAAYPRRRLTAEEVRDTYLCVANILDRVPGGAHPFPPTLSWSFTQHSPFSDDYDTNKRSVYVMQKRNRRTPFFALFDGPDPNTSTALRDNTTVPTQALWLMNNPLIHRVAALVALRTQGSSGSDTDSWLQSLYQTVLGRGPTANERTTYFMLELGLDDGESTAWKGAWVSYVRALLVSNEVLYVD